jgi:hypothetical protein
VCQELKGCSEEFGNEFLHITTVGILWMFHNDPTTNNKEANGKFLIL